MGKNTWESLPKKPLPDRINVIISNNEFTKYEDYIKENNLSDTYVYKNIKDSITSILKKDVNEIFIIGGEKLYKNVLEEDICTNVYLTKIDNTYDCDTFLKGFNESNFKYKKVIDQYIDKETNIIIINYLYSKKLYN